MNDNFRYTLKTHELNHELVTCYIAYHERWFSKASTVCKYCTLFAICAQKKWLEIQIKRWKGSMRYIKMELYLLYKCSFKEYSIAFLLYFIAKSSMVLNASGEWFLWQYLSKSGTQPNIAGSRNRIFEKSVKFIGLWLISTKK